jgi:hypothetical protein
MKLTEGELSKQRWIQHFKDEKVNVDDPAEFLAAQKLHNSAARNCWVCKNRARAAKRDFYKKKLTKEDILKYGTKDEIVFLKEYMQFAVQHPEIPDVGDIILYAMKKWVVQKRQPKMDDPNDFTFIISPYPVTGGKSAYKTITLDDITQVIQKGASRPTA